MQPASQVSTFSVTVVVCTRDRPERLEECLRALRSQAYPRFDILVVDNASATPVAGICARFGAGCVRAPVPGLTRARNIGARLARGEIVAYIDDDAIVEPAWLQTLVAGFGDPSVAAVSGRVRYMKAIGDSRAISDEVAPDDRPRPPGRFDLATPDWFATASFGGVGDGGNMAFRRSVIEAGACFDERLGRGQLIDSGDEHLLFASLIARGHVILHEPDAVVRHPSPAAPELAFARRFADLRSSIAYLAFLWGRFPQRRGDMLAFLARAVARRMSPAWVFGTCTGWSSAAKAVAEGFIAYANARREWARVPAHRADQPAEPMPRLVDSSLDSH